jgi:antirestriction protein ArdC
MPVAERSKVRVPRADAPKVDVYEEVTRQIVSALESGTVPWKRPWKAVGGDVPRNLISGKSYRGINQLLLSLTPYESPFWLTFKQCKEKGGKVRKGEKSTLIVFWKRIQIEDKDTGKKKTIPLLKYYRVFNTEQCDGLNVPDPESLPEFDPITEADRIITEAENMPQIVYGGDSACYVPAMDVIRMPQREAFTTPSDFYRVCFHEMTHATGHADRLAREGITQFDRFGSERYSREELIAEMGSAMLSTVANLPGDVIPPSASYIASWLNALNNDPKMVIHAAGKAQRAADFILGADDGSDHE